MEREARRGARGDPRREPPFKFSAPTRVGFSDTDAQGVVYYGRYMPYFDLARVEYLRRLGLLQRRAAERRVRDAGERRRVLRAGPLRRPDRGLRAGRADRAHERHLRVRRLPRGTRRSLVTAHQTLVFVDLAERKARPGPGRLPRGRSSVALTPTSSSAQTVSELAARDDCAWAGIFFVEDDSSCSGPRPARRSGAAHDASPSCGATRASPSSPSTERRAGRARARRRRIADLCLVGWDTGGEPWETDNAVPRSRD